jgi:hypothetical protein
LEIPLLRYYDERVHCYTYINKNSYQSFYSLLFSFATLISALRKDKKDKLLSSKRFRLAEGEEITDEYTISEVC